MQSIADKMLTSIQRKGRGYVFTPRDVLRHGSRSAVDQALSRLARDGKIRRLRHGLYDYPMVSPRLGTLSPDPRGIADALARKTGSRIMPSGAYAANVLGLSTQVPARPVYLTDGPGRTVTVGGQTIQLRHTPARYFGKSNVADMAIQAIRFLGRHAMSADMVQRIRSALPDADRAILARTVGITPGWMTPYVSQIALA